MNETIQSDLSVQPRSLGFKCFNEYADMQNECDAVRRDGKCCIKHLKCMKTASNSPDVQADVEANKMQLIQSIKIIVSGYNWLQINV